MSLFLDPCVLYCTPNLLKFPIITYSSGLLWIELMDACNKNNDENVRFPFPWSSHFEGLLEPNK